jgi:exosortase
MIFHSALRNLISLSFHKELYSHILLMPFISGFFLYRRRRNIFFEMQYAPTAGFLCITISILLYLISRNQGNILNLNDYLSIATFAGLTTWIGCFIFLFGMRSFRKAAFPLFLLVFMVPVPTLLMEHIIHFLQKGSTETAYMLFQLTGIPMFREGFTFYFPTISIEVAEQCSGIRSSIALLITAIIASQLFLRTRLHRIILLSIVIPITIFKNAVRIVTLTLLSIYVDESFIDGSLLHRKGGIFFFLLAISILFSVLLFLRKSERKIIKLKGEC